MPESIEHTFWISLIFELPGDRGMLFNNTLHHARVNVDATRDFDVLQPVLDVQKALGIQVADVARMQPAPAQRLGRCPRLLPVAAHQLRAVHHDFASHPRRQPPSMLGDNRNAGREQRPTDRAEEVRAGLQRSTGIGGCHHRCVRSRARAPPWQRRNPPECTARRPRPRVPAPTTQHRRGASARRPGCAHLAFHGARQPIWSTFETIDCWVSTAPFGCPVVPLVYTCNRSASGSGRTASNSASDSRWIHVGKSTHSASPPSSGEQRPAAVRATDRQNGGIGCQP